MDAAVVSKADRIRTINDRCRKHFLGCQPMLTAAVAALEPEHLARLLLAVRDFNAFDSGNDPHHEHDMAFFEHEGESFFFKFDYYDQSMEYGSDDPADTEKTRRVLTIGFASDY